VDKSPDAFRTISEVAEELDVPQHVLRFWESRFREIKPLKRGGGRRFYRPDDVDLLRGIRHLLYGEGYTIRGVQRLLREQGLSFVQEVWQAGAPQVPAPPAEDAEDATEPPPQLRRAAVVRSSARDEDEFPAAAPMPPRTVRALPTEDVRKLNDVLRELGECRKLLEAASQGR
jgi:DNA-binding transcriptional MerR regulator